MLWGFGLVLLGWMGRPGAALAQGKTELRIAAASDLQPVMPVLAAMYLKRTGVKLVVNFGSSGALATQIENGAPVDLFLGADFIYPEKLVAAGLADAKAPTAYAKGRLAVWARKDSPLQPISVDKLTDARIQRIAVADPMHAPFGRAAAAALERMKMMTALKPKLVVAENVAQAGQFAESGNAQVGLISLTLASSQRYKELGSYAIVPDSQYPEIRQTAVVLRKSDRRSEAHAFLDLLLSSEIQVQLPEVGMEAVR
ncbi:MAG: molybdate ABC transporter substrate-binding protein [Acidobacteriaceae bacterium]